MGAGGPDRQLPGAACLEFRFFVYHWESIKPYAGINCAHLLPTLICSSRVPADGAGNKGICFLKLSETKNGAFKTGPPPGGNWVPPHLSIPLTPNACSCHHESGQGPPILMCVFSPKDPLPIFPSPTSGHLPGLQHENIRRDIKEDFLMTGVMNMRKGGILSSP